MDVGLRLRVDIGRDIVIAAGPVLLRGGSGLLVEALRAERSVYLKTEAELPDQIAEKRDQHEEEKNCGNTEKRKTLFTHKRHRIKMFYVCQFYGYDKETAFCQADDIYKFYYSFGKEMTQQADDKVKIIRIFRGHPKAQRQRDSAAKRHYIKEAS